MEKKRIMLSVCGVSIPLITSESEEYINSLASETERMIREISGMKLEISAITAALSYLDEKKKAEQVIAVLQEEAARLKEENAKLKEHVRYPKEIDDVKNPIKALYETDNSKLTCYYIKNENEEEANG